jgi:transcriptional regulator with XRE-family HTH domain
MNAAKLIREARRRAGLTQRELGDRSHRAGSAISRWERGEVEPSITTLREIIDAAGFELVIGLAPKDEHDLALVRRSLRQEPSDRLAEMVKAVRALDKMAASVG